MNETRIRNIAKRLIDSGFSRKVTVKVLTTIWDIPILKAIKCTDEVIEYLREEYK